MPTAHPPPVLGRSVLVRPGQAPPDPYRGADRLVADPSQLDDLEAAWRSRTPLVIEAGPDHVGPGAGGGPDGGPPGDATTDESDDRPLWSLPPDFSFPGERLRHAATANSLDLRGGTTVWPWADAARRLGATGAPPGGGADVVLPDGRPARCDGGPFEWRDGGDGPAVVHRLSLLAGSLTPFGPNRSAAELAPDQLQAVLHPGGAARIIAPAGSGKTRVLTERARHLLRAFQVPPRAVTLVAFNKRAADEMAERTPDLPELRVRTLNALSLALVNRRQRVTTIEEREVRTILGSLVDLPRRANTDPAVAWMEALSAVRLGLQPPARVEAEMGGDVDGLPEVFDRYRALLADRNLVDFDEQVYGALELLVTDPAARRRARTGARLLLVDEFQDLTPAHLLLVRLLTGPDGAVFGVGDDDQTIYGFSGASPQWLIDYRRYFPTAGEHPLEVNYRCPPAVVEAAATLLTHNRRRVDKTVRAAPGREPRPGDLAVRTGSDPLAVTVETVQRLLDEGAPPATIAVLTRVNASLAPVQVALVERGLPVRPAVDAAYLSRGGVAAALAWLRLAVAGPQVLSGADVRLAARRPPRGLSPRLVDWMAEQSSRGGLQRLAGRLSDRDGAKVQDFLADLEQVQRAATGRTVDVLATVRDGLGLDEAMRLLEGSRRRLDRSAQTDDLEALMALAALHPDPAGFEAWLRHCLSDPGRADGIRLATVHSVKGRQWPWVVVHDASAGLMPHRLSEDVEEERRVFHVALTRCSEGVTVVGGPDPSPFLKELTERWTPGRSGPVLPPRRAEPAFGPGTRSPRAGAAGGGRRRPAVGRGGPEAPAAEMAPEARERARVALRKWRTERARAEGKPPYVFFNDRTLEDLVRVFPSDPSSLARVHGVGPAKLAAYGDDWLALLETAGRPGP
jgi:DNA helicase-2/ATP-dependent DNA helicase PcrA